MTEATKATRIVGDIEVPIAGTWKVDPGHAQVGFMGRHFMLTKIRGRFTGVDGAVEIADDPHDSRVSMTIDMSSVDSGDDTRDAHLKSADFFDVDTHEDATFASTAISWNGAAGTMTGDLTIKGVARSVTLEVDYLGYAQDPWDNHRAIFSANGRVNREDWGLTWNMPLANGGLLVSKEIDIEIEAELILQS